MSVSQSPRDFAFQRVPQRPMVREPREAARQREPLEIVVMLRA